MADYVVFRDRFRDKLVYKIPQKTFTLGAAETTGSFTVQANARVAVIVADVPNWTNVVTCLITVANSDSKTIYSSDALARNTVHTIYGLEQTLILWGENTFTYTLSGVPGGAGGSIYTSVYFL